MVTKGQFILKLKGMLKKYIPTSATETAINEMNAEKLNGIKDSSPLSEKLIDENLVVLYSRINFIKGDLAASSFVEEFNNWRYE